MALVYPMACKVATTWFVDNKGLAIGMIVGAVGVGSASPQLLRFVGGGSGEAIPWQVLIGSTSGLSAGASLIALLWLREGPHGAPAKQREMRISSSRGVRDVAVATDAEERLADAVEGGAEHKNDGQRAGKRRGDDNASLVRARAALSNRGRDAGRGLSGLVRNRAFWLSVIGYSGHNWELYALWLWFKRFSRDAGIGALLADSTGYSADSGDSLAAFVVVSSAFIGCILGGLAADRVGRTTVCLYSLTASTLGSLTIGWTIGYPSLTFAIALVWGVFAVAESAQFSAMTAELVPADLVGNAITLQFGVGFLCTMPGMFLVPMLAPSDGAGGGGGNWALAWGSLAPGTAIAAVATLLLRRHPKAQRVAKLRGRSSF
jgi:hypothetical protein